MQPSLCYSTSLGMAFCGDSLDLLAGLSAESIDLIVTSPPFPLVTQKAYGNETQDSYVAWLLEFGRRAQHVLRDSGSLVLDLGGAYQRGIPVRSLHQFRALIHFVDELGYFLAQEFYWHNPSKLPSPTEWVNKRRIRVKDTVNTIWWLSKTEWPQADTRKVLVEYSSHMKKLLEDGGKYYQPKSRPSGHDISPNFDSDNGGAIPPNFLSIANTESNTRYLNHCKALGIPPHPARFPRKLPSFFISLLTRPDDVVADIFAGSNTTGEAAERLGRRWISCELDRQYVAASAFRFVSDRDLAQESYNRVINGDCVKLLESSRG